MNLVDVSVERGGKKCQVIRFQDKRGLDPVIPSAEEEDRQKYCYYQTHGLGNGVLHTEEHGEHLAYRGPHPGPDPAAVSFQIPEPSGRLIADQSQCADLIFRKGTLSPLAGYNPHRFVIQPYREGEHIFDTLLYGKCLMVAGDGVGPLLRRIHHLLVLVKGLLHGSLHCLHRIHLLFEFFHVADGLDPHIPILEPAQTNAGTGEAGCQFVAETHGCSHIPFFFVKQYHQVQGLHEPDHVIFCLISHPPHLVDQGGIGKELQTQGQLFTGYAGIGRQGKDGHTRMPLFPKVQTNPGKPAFGLTSDIVLPYDAFLQDPFRNLFNNCYEFGILNGGTFCGWPDTQRLPGLRTLVSHQQEAEVGLHQTCAPLDVPDPEFTRTACKPP